MEKILSSAMAEEEISKLEARNQEIAASIEEKKASFDEDKDIVEEIAKKDIKLFGIALIRPI